MCRQLLPHHHTQFNVLQAGSKSGLVEGDGDLLLESVDVFHRSWTRREQNISQRILMTYKYQKVFNPEFHRHKKWKGSKFIKSVDAVYVSVPLASSGDKLQPIWSDSLRKWVLLTSDEVANLVVGQRIIVAASGGNLFNVTESLVEKEAFIQTLSPHKSLVLENLRFHCHVWK